MKKLPKRIDCRVDFTKICGTNYSLLVESESNEVLVAELGYKKVNDMYKDLKWALNNSLPIDNYPYIGIKYYQIEGANYDYTFKAINSL